MAATDSPVAACIAPIWLPISSVALAHLRQCE
jgi:hypothetical protein